MEREALIKKCEQHIIPESEWSDRDDPSAISQLGELWAYLKAGCDYKKEGDNRVTVYHKSFHSIEYGSDSKDKSFYYFPK